MFDTELEEIKSAELSNRSPLPFITLARTSVTPATSLNRRKVFIGSLMPPFRTFLCVCVWVLTIPHASESMYITQLEVSRSDTEEIILRNQGFSKIPVDLNKGAGGNYIYLWYQKARCCPGITRMQLSFNDDMGRGLREAGYHKIDKDLNAGSGGDFIYLWYFKGSTEYDIPIEDIHVSTEEVDEAERFELGYEKLACDLNRNARGNWIFLWIKRQRPVFISDLTATEGFDVHSSFFQQGYIRVDEDTNRGAGGRYIYIWYRLTTDEQRAIRDVQVSLNNEEYQSFQNQRYQLVNMDLNKGAGGNYVFLWYKADDCSFRPIKALTVMINSGAADSYQRAGVHVLKKDLNKGNDGNIQYVCFYG